MIKDAITTQLHSDVCDVIHCALVLSLFEHRGYRRMSRRTQAFCRKKLPCSGGWEREGPVLLRFRMLNLMLGRSHCLCIAVNQLSYHLKGLKY